MIFVDTKRFSPVAQGKDMPKGNDLFYVDPLEVSSLNQKDMIRYCIDKKIVIDDDWWKRQLYRIYNGYTVENAIERGGDVMIDGVDSLWTGDDCYLPEYDLMINNKTVHISGRYYFYLNFWRIRGKEDNAVRKTLINPRFLMMDFFYFRRREMMEIFEKDMQDVKARQVGHSEKLAADATYNYLFFPMSQNIIVAGEQTDADNTFNNVLRGQENLANTQFTLRRKRGFDNRSHIKSMNGSEILTENANDDPQALSRYSPTLVIYEEIGKGKKKWSLKVEGFVSPSLMVEGKKTGYSIYLGTGGDMDDGVYDLQERAYNPDKHNILSFSNKWVKEGYDGNVKVCHFIPKYMYKILDKDGNPLKEESIRVIKEEGKNKDTSQKYLHECAEAIYLEDVFQTNNSGYLGPERKRLLLNRYNYILTHRDAQITRKGHLEWKKAGDIKAGVYFVDATEEEIKKDLWYCEMVEEPDANMNGDVYENLYVAGTDTYNQDEAENSDSEGAFTIYKKWRNNSDSPFFNTWTFMIVERPGVGTGGQNRFFEHVLMGCIYYNVLNNIEFVNPLIFDYFEKMNSTKYLMEKPQLAFAGYIKENRSSNRYGTDKSLKPHVLSNWREIMTEEQINRLWIPRQILAFAKYVYSPGDKYNCDITIASAESLIAYKEIEHLKILDNSLRQTEKNPIWREINGILQRVAV